MWAESLHFVATARLRVTCATVQWRGNQDHVATGRKVVHFKMLHVHFDLADSCFARVHVRGDAAHSFQQITQCAGRSCWFYIADGENIFWFAVSCPFWKCWSIYRYLLQVANQGNAVHWSKNIWRCNCGLNSPAVLKQCPKERWPFFLKNCCCWKKVVHCRNTVRW